MGVGYKGQAFGRRVVVLWGPTQWVSRELVFEMFDSRNNGLD
jgi:hypothetical protein